MIWQHDPDLVRKRAVLGVVFGGLTLLIVIAILLVYFLILKPGKQDDGKYDGKDDGKDDTKEKKVFACNC